MHQSKRTFFYLLFIGGAIGLTVINCVLFMNKRGARATAPDHNTADSVVAGLERTYFRMAIKYADLTLLGDLSVADSIKEYKLPDFYERYIQTPKIIFRYADIGCSPCVDSSLWAIRSVEKQIGRENILILASYQNRRNLLIWKRINNIDYTVLNAPSEKVLPAVDVFNIPYFFVLSPNDKTVHQVFFPMKEKTSRTSDYLSAIVNRYIKQPTL